MYHVLRYVIILLHQPTYHIIRIPVQFILSIYSFAKAVPYGRHDVWLTVKWLFKISGSVTVDPLRVNSGSHRIIFLLVHPPKRLY